MACYHCCIKYVLRAYKKLLLLLLLVLQLLGYYGYSSLYVQASMCTVIIFCTELYPFQGTVVYKIVHLCHDAWSCMSLHVHETVYIESKLSKCFLCVSDSSDWTISVIDWYLNVIDGICIRCLWIMQAMSVIVMNCIRKALRCVEYVCEPEELFHWCH